MNTNKLIKISGDASYIGGSAVGTAAGIMMIRKMVKSDLASAWTLRPTPWVRLARRHRALTAIWCIAILAQVAGVVLRGPKVTVTEFPATEDLFPDAEEVLADISGEAAKRWHTAEDNSGLVLDQGKETDGE